MFLPISKLYVLHFDKIVICVKDSHTNWILSFKFQNLFMLLFIHLLYLIWRKVLCLRLWCWSWKDLGVKFFTHIIKWNFPLNSSLRV